MPYKDKEKKKENRRIYRKINNTMYKIYQIYDNTKNELITIDMPLKISARIDSNLARYNMIHNTTYDFDDIMTKFTIVELLCGKYSNNATNSSCLCGHNIHNLYTITNPENQHSIMMGSDCIKKYITNAMQICIDCKNKFKFNVKNTTCKKCTKDRKNASIDWIELTRTRRLAARTRRLAKQAMFAEPEQLEENEGEDL